MPVPPIWIQRLPDILAAVKLLPLEIDRDQIARLFSGQAPRGAAANEAVGAQDGAWQLED